MAEQVVIEFIGKTDDLQPAVDTFAKLGVEGDKVNKVFNETTRTTKAAHISIDQMSQSVRDLNANVLGDAGKKGLNDFGTQLQASATQSKSLKAQLIALKQELTLMEQAGQQGSKAFLDLSIKAGKLQDQIGDTAARVRILASDTKNLQAALSVATGLAGAFAVAQGASALFGKNNEELQKSLLKVQAALAILNGLQAVSATLNKDSAAAVVLNSVAQKAYAIVVGTSTGALKAFRIALAATGIGLAVILIAALYNEWKKYTDALKVSEELQKKNTEARAKIAESVSKEITSVVSLLAVAKNENNTRAERTEVVKELQKLYPDYLQNLTLENAGSQEIADTINDKVIPALIKRAVIAGAQEEITEAARKYVKALLDQQTATEATEKAQDKLRKTTEFVSAAQQDVAKSIGDITQAATGSEVGKTKQALENLIKIFADLGGGENTTLGKLTDEATPGSIAFFTKRVADLEQELSTKVVPGTEAYRLKLIELTKAVRELVAAEEAVKKARGDELIGGLKKPFTEFPEIDEDPAVIHEKKVQTKIQEIIESTTEKQRLENVKKMEMASKFLSSIQQLGASLFEFTIANNQNEINSLEDKHRRGIISEKQYNRAIAEARHKQAKAEKAKAVFDIAIATSVAIMSALSIPPPAGTILAAIAAGIGAVQLAAVVTHKLPEIPQFAKGTKKAPPGMKLVGEKGPELIVDKGGYPIIPHQDTQKILEKWNVAMPALDVYPETPFISDSTMDSLEKGRSTHTGIDYDKLGQSVAKYLGSEIEKHPRLNVMFDYQNMIKVVSQGANKQKSLDDFYSWNG